MIVPFAFHNDICQYLSSTEEEAKQFCELNEGYVYLPFRGLKVNVEAVNIPKGTWIIYKKEKSKEDE